MLNYKRSSHNQQASFNFSSLQFLQDVKISISHQRTTKKKHNGDGKTTSLLSTLEGLR